MNYSAELKKFVTSQYVYSGVRIALATSFVGLTDQPEPSDSVYGGLFATETFV